MLGRAFPTASPTKNKQEANRVLISDGVDGSINYAASVALHRGKILKQVPELANPLSTEEKRMLELILSGATRTYERLAAAGLSEATLVTPRQ